MIVSELFYDSESDIVAGGQASIISRSGDRFDIQAATHAGRPGPADAPKPNEDAYAVTYHDGILTAAIFDGASSQKAIPELGSTSGARYASHTLRALFETATVSEPTDMLRQLNRSLRKKLLQFPSVDYADLNSLPTSTATIVQLDRSNNSLAAAHIGDSFAAALGNDGTTTLLTNNLHRPSDEKVLQLILDIARKSGTNPREARSDPRIRTAIMDMFQGTRNRPDGTGEGMVNGDPNMEQYIHYFRAPLTSIRAVLLGSDGLVSPGMDERKDDDRAVLLQTASRHGVAGLITRTRQIEDADPDRWLLRYKHADDATGILIQIARMSPTIPRSLSLS